MEVASNERGETFEDEDTRRNISSAIHLDRATFEDLCGVPAIEARRSRRAGLHSQDFLCLCFFSRDAALRQVAEMFLSTNEQ